MAVKVDAAESKVGWPAESPRSKQPEDYELSRGQWMLNTKSDDADDYDGHLQVYCLLIFKQ